MTYISNAGQKIINPSGIRFIAHSYKQTSLPREVKKSANNRSDTLTRLSLYNFDMLRGHQLKQEHHPPG